MTRAHSEKYGIVRAQTSDSVRIGNKRADVRVKLNMEGTDMNVYDKAHELAACMKESDEYRDYQRLREAAYQDSTNKALLDEYKRLQFQAQVKFASGDRPEESDMQRLQAIGNLLQFNSDASSFLLAEFRFQKMLADIYKILGDAAGIDLDMLRS